MPSDWAQLGLSLDLGNSQLFAEYPNMNGEKEHHENRDTAVEDQNDWELIQDHAEQAGGKGNRDQSEQQPALCAKFPAEDDGMDDAQQQEHNGCELVDVDPGQGDQDGDKEADQQPKIQCFFHTATGSLPAGMVFTPQIK